MRATIRKRRLVRGGIPLGLVVGRATGRVAGEGPSVAVEGMVVVEGMAADSEGGI